MINISIDSAIFSIESKDELEKKLNALDQVEFSEIWISGHSDSTLCVLKNKAHAFVIYKIEQDNSSFSSRNLIRNTNQYIEFLLSNGQVDEYPNSWIISYEKAKEVIYYYFSTGEKSKAISWEED